MLIYRAAYSHPQFNTDVMKPLMIDNIKDQEIQNLSGLLYKFFKSLTITILFAEMNAKKMVEKPYFIYIN